MVATPVVVALTLGGKYALLCVDGCTLTSRDVADDSVMASVELPHTIRAVFLADAADEPCSVVFVVMDGPAPVVEVDYVAGGFSTVMDASTRAPLLARRSSDVSVDSILASRGSHHVAVARSDGSVVLYRVEEEHAAPSSSGTRLSWAPIDSWDTLSRVSSMVFAGNDVLPAGACAEHTIPSYIVAIAQKGTSSTRQLFRLAIEHNTCLRVVSAGVDATALSAVPDCVELVALFSPSEPEVSYMNVRGMEVQFAHHIQSVGDTRYPSCVALRGGEYGKYAAVVSDGAQAVVMTGDDDVGVKMLPTTLEGGALWRALAVGGTTAALAGKSEVVLIDVCPKAS